MIPNLTPMKQKPTKKYFLCTWRDCKKIFVVYVLMVNVSKLNFTPKISSIFHFDQVNHGRISHILCVKSRTSLETDGTLDFDCFHLGANF